MDLYPPEPIQWLRGDGPTGILLTNLGTPDAPSTQSLRPYLKQFLSDPRVVEAWRPLWWCILNGIILPTRPRKSARAYRAIWRDEGSPLLINSHRQLAALRQRFVKEIDGDNLHLTLGMRYGQPSIPSALNYLRRRGCKRIIILPLYPQYSAATVGSTFDEVADELKTWRYVPQLQFINGYYQRQRYIEALAHSIRAYWDHHGEPELLLFSFHGVPQRYVQRGDPYRAECEHTTQLVVEALHLQPHRWKLTFQSRFGKEPWLTPYTDEFLKSVALQGTRKVDVICPGFSADCLETLEEVAGESRELFEEQAARYDATQHIADQAAPELRYIPALNDQPQHIDLFEELIRERL